MPERIPDCRLQLDHTGAGPKCSNDRASGSTGDRDDHDDRHNVAR